MNKKYIYNHNGFTLAEVLIVLAIIGVVAALTIPMLMSNYQKTQQVTALKKVYSQISEAIERVMTDSNAENFNDVALLNGNDADPKTFFKKYFKVSKYCDRMADNTCFAEVSIINNPSTKNHPASGWSCAIVKDGASVCIAPGYPDKPACFLVDTNGIDKPNIAGRDVFTFDVWYDGSIDEIDPERRDASDSRRQDRENRCGDNTYGSGCFSKIIDAGWKMDY